MDEQWLMTYRSAERQGENVMKGQQKQVMRKNELSREQMAVYVAARYAAALVEVALMGAVQYADNMGGLRAGDVRIEGKPYDAQRELMA